MINLPKRKIGLPDGKTALPDSVTADIHMYFKLINGGDDGSPAYAAMTLKNVTAMPCDEASWNDLAGRMIQGIPCDKDKITTCSYAEYLDNAEKDDDKEEWPL